MKSLRALECTFTYVPLLMDIFVVFRGYIFLFNLALIDLLTACGAMPISLVTLLNGRFIFSQQVCDYNAFSTQAFFIANILTLMFMSVYR